jgi:hypothetical protein
MLQTVGCPGDVNLTVTSVNNQRCVSSKLMFKISRVHKFFGVVKEDPAKVILPFVHDDKMVLQTFLVARQRRAKRNYAPPSDKDDQPHAFELL